MSRINDFSDKFIKKMLRKHPYCEVCKVSPTTEIHHIIPVCDGGTNDPDNAAALCHFCHKGVPGDKPDGYKEEFEIYKQAGGAMWFFFKLGFAAAAQKYAPSDLLTVLPEERKAKKECQKLLKGKFSDPSNIHIMMS